MKLRAEQGHRTSAPGSMSDAAVFRPAPAMRVHSGLHSPDSQSSPHVLRSGGAGEQALESAADRTAATLGSGAPARTGPSSSAAATSAPPGMGPGQTVPRSVRAPMEARLGFDFSNVRIHTDDRASSSASAWNARAYTLGSHIVFGRGSYQPHHPAGRQLLAHELTHVTQQGGTPRLLRKEASPGLSGPPREGKDIRKLGVVSNEDGVNLRQSPDGAIVRRLPFNTSLFVSREVPGDWYFVTLNDGSYGYVFKNYINTNQPEPRATLHRIRSGESALRIVKQYYKGDAISWGQDERFYVNVLVYANQGDGPRGIYKPGGSNDWADTQTREGYLIWIPSLQFAQGLRGKVSSGSISYELWQDVKSAVKAAVEFVVGGAAFIAGLLHGALESVWDLLTGLVDLGEMVWKVVKSLFTGNILSDAEGLWDLVKELDVKQLVAAGLKSFVKKWNDPSLLTRWHFRGWLVGYALAEIAMAFLSGGATMLKWAGKAGKFAKLLSTFPRVAKFADKAAELGRVLPDASRRKLATSLSATPADEAARAAKQGSKVDVPKHAEQPRVASGVAEDPGPVLRGGVLDARQEDFLTRLVEGGGIAKIGKREVTVTDLAALTKHSGREHALVILKDNSRALVDMGSYKGGTLTENTKRLLMHSHPEDWGSGMAKFISKEDVDALLILKQRYSYMVTIDGTVYRFTMKTVPMTVGDVVRQFHPILGWVTPGT